MSIGRDKDFEQLEDIAAMMTENTDIEFENGKYVYYGLDGRTAFVAVYISGAWAGWQAAKVESHKQAALYQFEINHLAQANAQWRDRAAKAQEVPEGFILVPKEPTLEMLIAADNCEIDGKVTANNIYKAMIEAQESK